MGYYQIDKFVHFVSFVSPFITRDTNLLYFTGSGLLLDVGCYGLQIRKGKLIAEPVALVWNSADTKTIARCGSSSSRTLTKEWVAYLF